MGAQDAPAEICWRGGDAFFVSPEDAAQEFGGLSEAARKGGLARHSAAGGDSALGRMEGGRQIGQSLVPRRGDEEMRGTVAKLERQDPESAFQEGKQRPEMIWRVGNGVHEGFFGLLTFAVSLARGTGLWAAGGKGNGHDSSGDLW